MNGGAMNQGRKPAVGPPRTRPVPKLTGRQVAPAIQPAKTLAHRRAIERQARRMAVLGSRAVTLGLDLVPGVVWVEVTDPTNAIMMPRTAHVVVYGGDPRAVFSMIERTRPRGIELTVEVAPARLRHRLAAWARWQWWRLFLRRAPDQPKL